MGTRRCVGQALRWFVGVGERGESLQCVLSHVIYGERGVSLSAQGLVLAESSGRPGSRSRGWGKLAYPRDRHGCLYLSTDCRFNLMWHFRLIQFCSAIVICGAWRPACRAAGLTDVLS